MGHELIGRLVTAIINGILDFTFARKHDELRGRRRAPPADTELDRHTNKRGKMLAKRARGITQLLHWSRVLGRQGQRHQERRRGVPDRAAQLTYVEARQHPGAV